MSHIMCGVMDNVQTQELKTHPMYMKTKLTNVSFTIGNTILYVSEYIICSLSDYFCTLVEEFKGESIQLNEDPCEFIAFLNTFHPLNTHDKLKINEQNVSFILKLSNKYGILEIYDNCVSYISENIGTCLDYATSKNLVESIYSYGDNKNAESLIRSHIRNWDFKSDHHEHLLNLTPIVSKMYLYSLCLSYKNMLNNMSLLLDNLCHRNCGFTIISTQDLCGSLFRIPNTTPEQAKSIKTIVEDIKAFRKKCGFFL